MMRKCPISKSGEVLALFDAHVPKTSYDKKAEGITKCIYQ